jgi:hypothetical protein
MENEIWKDIPSYEGLYQVSNLGNIKSLSRLKFSYGFFRKQNKRILKLATDKKGYLICVLCKNTHRKTIKVHQLVAMAFLNHIPCGMVLVVDHINDVRNDNRLENLRIITNRENSYRTQGKYTSKYKGVFWDKSRSKWRAEITINNKNNYLGRFDTEEEAYQAYQNKLKEIS